MTLIKNVQIDNIANSDCFLQAKSSQWGTKELHTLACQVIDDIETIYNQKKKQQNKHKTTKLAAVLVPTQAIQCKSKVPSDLQTVKLKIIDQIQFRDY